MKRFAIPVVLAALNALAGTSTAQTSAVVTHSEFQAVNAQSEQVYTATERVTLEGILLHHPADMLDPTPDETITETFNLGGTWQIFFQGVGDDHAGTAVFLGQLYNNLPWVAADGGYTNEQFVAELARLNSACFGPGDRIRVTGYFLSYKGKLNINEQHNKNPDHDFTIELLEKGAGLPRPEVVALAELKDAEDDFVFDPTRQTGCEYYQSRLVKIEGVYFVDPSGWGPDAELTMTDGTRTFPVKLGRGNGIYAGSNNLAEPFDAIGIVDQESTDLTRGYRLYVMNYDGNGSMLAGREHRRADKPGDLDLDGIVDLDDVAELLEDWNGSNLRKVPSP